MHAHESAAYCPRPAEMPYRYLLGVKWSQVQILSARRRKGHLTCGDHTAIPRLQFSFRLLGATRPGYTYRGDPLVRWSSGVVSVPICTGGMSAVTLQCLIAG